MASEIFPIECQLEISEAKKRLVTKIKIIWSFVSFLISLADVAVILVLAHLHFEHAHDIVAWLMLLPILLNFIGIFAFLSDDEERREMEALGGECRCSDLIKNLMFVPIVGPAISSFRLFIYALEEEHAEKFERLESLLIKMKQYESFFRASPEAFVQMTFRIVRYSVDRRFGFEDHWTTACITLCIFSLSESNFYGLVRPYYRMFQEPIKLPKDSWETDKITIRWRILLFVFTYAAILSRLLSDAILRSSICLTFDTKYSFGEVLAMTLIAQFVLRALIHAIVLRPRENIVLKGDDQGRPHPITAWTVDYEAGPVVYRAFTYSWKSIFMAFDFQNPDLVVFVWFYVENFLMIFGAYAVLLGSGVDLSKKSIYFYYTGIAVFAMFLGIAIKYTIAYWFKKPYTNLANNQCCSENHVEN